MNVEVSAEALIVGAAFLGGQIAILAGVVRSNRDQGRRIGALEKWQERHDAVSDYKTQRHVAPVFGVPTQDDDT